VVSAPEQLSAGRIGTVFGETAEDEDSVCFAVEAVELVAGYSSDLPQLVRTKNDRKEVSFVREYENILAVR
jgi:hypothetical protein